MKRIALLLAGLFLLLSGCGGSYESHDSSAAYTEEAAEYESGFVSDEYASGGTAGGGSTEAQPAETAGLKLVYTGYVSIQSTEYDATVADVKALITEYRCIVESADESNYDTGWRDAAYNTSARDFEWVIRVPSDSFQELMERFGAVHGHVESKNQSAEDMTKRFRDNESRIASLKAQEERLLSFMENAETISETLEIEDRLSEVRYELEQLQNANNDIDFMAQYSKLTVRVHEVVDYDTAGMSFGQRVVQAFSTSSSTFVRVVQVLIILLIWLLPYLAIAAVVVLILFLTRDKRAAKRAVRKEKRRQKKEARYRRKLAKNQPPQAREPREEDREA